MFFGFKNNNEIKGYVTLKPFFPGRSHCEMYWLAVKKHYHGQGIGTKLVKFIENYAKKNGFRKLCVYTNKKMIRTRKYYEKIGYKFINEFPEFYGYRRNNTAVLYYKKI